MESNPSRGNLPKDQTLPAQFVSRLLAARDGTLWIGTMKGLASWKNGRLTRYAELDGKMISSLHEDREGSVWVGSIGVLTGELCVIRNAAVRCHGDDGRFARGVFALYEYGGYLWAAAQSGLWRWSPGDPELYPIPTAVQEMYGLVKGDNGALWVSTFDGIRQLVNGAVEPYRLAGAGHLNARRMLRDRDGGLWIGTFDRGLAHVRQGRIDVFGRADGLSGDYIGRLFEDREGNLWVTTQDGLDRFREFPVSTYSTRQGLSSDRIGSLLAAQDGSVWLGTSKGLNRWSNGRFSASGGPGVTSLFQDRRGRVWVSTMAAFGYVQGDNFHPVSGVGGGLVTFIVEDTAGNLWIGHQERGLFRLSPALRVETVRWAELARGEHASAAAADDSGGVWFGFFSGGIAYWKDGRVHASYSRGDGLGEGYVGALQMDRDGSLWASTEGGLSRLKDARIATLTGKNGLPCDSVHWTVEDDDRAFWLYTACGLIRIARPDLDRWVADPNHRVAAALYDGSDGVRIRANATRYSPQVAKTRDGKLWFVQGNGVSVVDPGRLSFNSMPPPVHIERVVADHRTYDTTAGLRLPALTHNLEIGYTALSLVAPEKSRFRFKLEGYDADWRDAGTRREAVYPDLPPRKYRFRVIASNNSGVWNEAGAALEFAIAPAYYQTSWFQFSCAVVTLALLGGLYRLRLRRLAWQYKVRLEERLAERSRVAQDLHDTLLQGILSASMHVDLAADILPEDSPAKPTVTRALELMRQVVDEGRKSLQGLRSCDSPSLDMGEAFSLVQDEVVAKCKAGWQADFRVVVVGQQRPLNPLLRDEMYRIGREALINAFRHSGAKHVEVRIQYSPDELRILVKDDGRGIDPRLLAAGCAGHWGLTGMRERAEQIGARLQLSSRVRAGTEVEVSAPGHTAFVDHAKPRPWRRNRPVSPADADRVR